LPKEVVYSIFLFAVQEDIFYATSAFRLVCRSWNEAFSLNDRNNLKSLLQASSSAARLFIGDLIVQIVRKSPFFNVRPWPRMEYEEACTQLVEISNKFAAKNLFCLMNVAREFGRFIAGVEVSERDLLNVELYNIFDKYFLLLYKEIMTKARFTDYAELDRFMRGILKELNQKLPFLMNEQILWPNPTTLLSEEGGAIISHFEFTANKVLDYLERANLLKTLSENDAIAVFEKLLTKVSKDELACRAIFEHKMIGRYSRDMIEFMLSNTGSDFRVSDESMRFVPLHSMDHHFNSGNRDQRLEYHIDEILDSPGQMDRTNDTMRFFLLKYMLEMPEVYGRADLKWFIQLCLDSGVDEVIVRRIVFATVTGANIVI
jgi:hypothetical protein